MAVEKVLVVEDDKDISDLIELYLLREGYGVYMAQNGSEAITMFKEYKPELVVLDVMLPEKDGFEVCKDIRQESDTPIIFISARDGEDDKANGFDIGGDDYLTKPFSPKELVARVKARLRRPHVRDIYSGRILRYEGIEIDTEAFSVVVAGSQVDLSAKEFDILLFMATNNNKVVSLDQLFQALWDTERSSDQRTVVVHISNMRKKIEAAQRNQKIIATVRGLGYKFLPLPIN